LNTDNLSRWISAAANIAVLAGLVLVAVQINQSSSLARTALINEGNVVSNQIWANPDGRSPGQVIARAIECPERMTYADFMAMDAFLFSNMNMLYRDYQLTQEGLFTSSDWKASVDADLPPEKVAKLIERFPDRLTEGRSRDEAEAIHHRTDHWVSEGA
jgi:hypothetical protein